MRRVWTVVLPLCFLSIFCAAAKAAPPTAPLGHVGRWITDSQQRVAILHGLNMVYKRPPYYPAKVGFGADDATFLAGHGFNAIRLGVIYKGLEPGPPVGGEPSYNDAYLAQIANTQQTLASRGVYSQIDFHQDLFHEKFQGEGWPDWQVQDDGLANPQNGFPNNYLTNPALNRAFDHFWANDQVGGVRLQDEYATAWKHVARIFRGSNRVLGYDVMNEPWPGNGWQTCAQPTGCPQFDEGPLATMTRKTTAAIRNVDSRHIVWHEPNVIFNFGSQSHLPEIGSNSGFSFHDYCLNPGAPDCPATEAMVFQNADDVAAQTNRALLLSEFGATDDLAEINRIANLADQHMVSWLEWHYCGCSDPTTTGPGDTQALVKDPSKPPRGTNLKHNKLKALDRAYPQAVAGTPEQFQFNPGSGVFNLRYSTMAPVGHRLAPSVRTVVFLPHIHYPSGYRVRVTGARVVSAAGAQRLVLERFEGATEVRLEVSPTT
ncbi:MAG TPA: cellulase family glycosylhydrolase [Solirubrobacterales bacterium]|nr:cellulase family glycosylhydrolase [Solirubrobacterales bacterium]